MILNKLLDRFKTYRKIRQEQKEIHQKLDNLTDPVFLERAVKGMRKEESKCL